MKKQKRQLLVLLVLLAAILAGFFGLQAYNKWQEELPKAEDTSPVVADLERDAIVKFSYDYEGVTYSFVKEGDTWYYEGDKSLSLAQSDIYIKLAKLSPMKAEQTIENVTDFTQYGLDTPSKVLQFETASESVILHVGDYNSLSKVYYVCKPSENTVYTVSSPGVNAFNYTVEDMVEETVSEGDNA